MAWTLQSSSDNGTVGNSLTVTAPTGIQVGNLLTAIGGVNNTSATITPPAGWSTDGFMTISGGTGNNTYVMSKIADSSDASASNFTFTSSTSHALRIYIQRWTGNATSSVVDVTNKDENADVYSGSQTFTAGATQTNAGSLVIIAGCGEPGTNVSIPQPSLANNNPGTWTKHVADTIFNMWWAERSSSGATGDITTNDWGAAGGGTKGGLVMVIYNAGTSGPTNLKTVNGLAKASVKTVNGLAIGSIKNFNGLN